MGTKKASTNKDGKRKYHIWCKLIIQNVVPFLNVGNDAEKSVKDIRAASMEQSVYAML